MSLNSEDKICQTPGCYNKRPYQQGGWLKLCWGCRTRLKKKRHPVEYEYTRVRSSAKRRGVPFNITIEEWRAWCAETGYMELKGKQKGDMSLGRKDHSKGYSLSNMILEEYNFNSIKGHEVPGQDVPQNHSQEYDGNEPF